MIYNLCIFCEENDKPTGEQLAQSLAQPMITVSTCVVNHFPMADPLALLLASLRKQYDLIVTLISDLSPQADWLLRELRAQRAMFTPVTAHPFVLIFTDIYVMPKWIADHDEPYIITSTLETMQDTIIQIIASRP